MNLPYNSGGSLDISDYFGSASSSNGLNIVDSGLSAVPFASPIVNGFESLMGFDVTGQISNFLKSGKWCIGNQAYDQGTVTYFTKELKEKSELVKKDDIKSFENFINYLSFIISALDYEITKVGGCSKETAQGLRDLYQKTFDGLKPNFPANYTTEKSSDVFVKTKRTHEYTKYNFSTPLNTPVMPTVNTQTTSPTLTPAQAEQILNDSAMLNQFTQQTGLQTTDVVQNLKAVVDGNMGVRYENGQIIWSASATNAPQQNNALTYGLLIIAGLVAYKFMKK
ncbi:hypothetical protein C3729_10415 [Cloacibacterium normanense]|uniref:Uncharacterized protein n=1 Tax=Cloacibacterium normanense TaxID=237258 RepID=A0A2S7I3C8_9FLAO|nr:hypothetical protein [Cloacibacterium normanense]PPZ91077.1 hypothetical protein C3729_10415 [Cloacibacterium normanense]